MSHFLNQVGAPSPTTSVGVAGHPGRRTERESHGTAVQLYDCNGTSAQNWTVGSDGTIRALGKCLDVASGGTADGTPVQLWGCNGTAAQKWVVTGARDIVNPQADKCLDVTDDNPANATRLWIWTCTGAADQKWTVG
ncbi:ricin-type beta-trefoil lectin domain protein [Streptomyces pimonensis]|uniref:Ricin-type beta-trefoil lectin domain protein n=1 Tax=Streptomyces pimonensis TaxID=2860288 RepID=A0ABV4J196_9ACTN